MAYTPPLNGGRLNANITGNTSGNTTYTVSTGTIFLSGGNNITLSQTNNSIGISGPTFVNSNGVTFGTNGNSVTASVVAGGGSVNFSASNSSANLASVVFANSNGVSFGLTTGSQITASINALTSQTLQTSNVIQALSAAGGSAATGTVSFANSNSINFGMNGQTITASYAGGGGVALTAPGSSFSSGTVNFSVTGGAISISGGANSINFAAPATSMLSATGGLSLSTTGSTVNIGAPAVSSVVGVNGINVVAGGSTITIDGAGVGAGSISNWEPIPIQFANIVATTRGNGTVYFYPLQLEANVSASRLLQLVSIGLSLSSNSSHAAAISMAAGIYTANGSTLSMITNSSGSQTYRWTNSASNSTSVISGLKGLTIPMPVNFTPGNYWIGMWSRTSTTNANWATISNVVLSQPNALYSNVIGSAAVSSAGIQEGGGYIGTSSSTLMSTIQMSLVNQSNLISNMMPYLNFKNVTY